jgi:glycosyltransferase involved in cell wall biosynthesis
MAENLHHHALIDGENPALSDQMTAIDIVKYQASNARLGISSTRNLALSRASGSLVQTLDHDDILLPNALEALIPRFTEYPIG